MVRAILSLLISIVFIFSLSNYVFSQENSDAIIGKWYTDNKEGVIQIYADNGKYYGKIIWMQEPNDANGIPKKDMKNPKEDLQNRKLVGINLLFDFVYHDNSVWEDGKMYNPNDGKFYSATLKIANKNMLELRGYLGFSWLGKTVVWTRKK